MVHVALRRLAVPLFLMLLLPSVASDPHPAQSATETLVEGHTVFTFLTAVDPTPAATFAPMQARAASDGEAGGAAGAAPSENVDMDRWPGVLWTNHQFLVEPRLKVNVESLPTGAVGTQRSQSHFAASLMALVHRSDGASSVTLPCGGALLAVNAGDPDPRGSVPGRTLVSVSSDRMNFGYQESYLVRDPNDRVWITDLYDARVTVDLDGFLTEQTWPVWVTNVAGSPVFVPDFEGPCPGPAADEPPAGYAEPSMNGYCFDARPAMGDCGSAGTPREYNGVFYFRFEDLTISGYPRSHEDSGGVIDVNACDAGSIWACPVDDDSYEGFSHPYHPDPWGTTPRGAELCPEEFYRLGGERSNHGGSTTWDQAYYGLKDADGYVSGEARYNGYGYCDKLHSTRHVDLYYDPGWRPPEPLVRDFVLRDTVGAEARFGQV